MNIALNRVHFRKLTLLSTGLFMLALFLTYVPKAAAATCATTTAPATTYGQVTQSVSVATAGTYRVWSRIKAPNTTNNSYYLQVDGGCALDVGDATSGIPMNSWTWINYQNGSTATHNDLTLTAGTHLLTYTGKEADVQLDRVLLLADLTCTPTGTGDNCVNVPVNPTVSITQPANNSSVTKGTAVNITTNVSTSTVKVDFLVDGTVVNTDTTAPFSYSWATTAATIGAHSLTARAYDASNATGSSTPITVNVTNAQDIVAPTASVSASPATVNVGSPVTLTATTTDNVGVTKVEFYVGTTLVGTKTQTTGTTSWNPTQSWTPAAADVGVKTVTVKAYDAAGNVAASSAISITVNDVTTTLTGDITGGPSGAPDGHVNGIDYGVLISHLGQVWAPGNLQGSSDPSNTVSAADIAILLGHWTW